METEHLEVVPRDLRRQAFYETVVSQIAHAGPEQVWRLIDTSLTVGMAAAWVDTGSIYAELPFDLAAYHLLESTNPQLAARFRDVRDGISNVSYVLRDCSKDVYDRKRADVWEFNLSRNERLGSALRLWLAFDAKLPGELIPILAPSAGKLLLAAAEAADLPFMAAATTNIIAGRLVRQKVAIPAFEESVISFAASVVAEVNAPESTHEIISGQVVSRSAPLGWLDAVLETVADAYDCWVPDTLEGHKQHAIIKDGAIQHIRSMAIPKESATCIARFIETELAYDSVDVRTFRGVAKCIQRFATLHPEISRRATQLQRETLRVGIRDVILAGYVFAEVILGVTERISPLPHAKRLFEDMWMPVYFSAWCPYVIDTKCDEFASIWGSGTSKKLRQVVAAQGGSWGEGDNAVISGYFLGGVRLRALESRSMNDDELRDAALTGLQEALLAVSKKENINRAATGCLLLVSSMVLTTLSMIWVGWKMASDS